MFRANQSNLQIPSKKILVKPVVNQDYSLTGSNNQIKFKLDPQSIPFFIANRTMLKMDVKMLGDVPNYRPCSSAGGQSLIRNLRVTSNGQELENVQEYNSLVAMKYSRNKTDSLDSKRTLFEGQSRTTDNSQSLYCEAPDALTVAGVTANKDNYRLITVELPLEAGLFNRDEVHCNALMPLDMTFNLENVKRACESISKVNATVGTLATALVSGTATTTIEVATTFQNNVFVGDSITLTEGVNAKTYGPITKIAADASPVTKMILTVPSKDPEFSYTTATIITVDASSKTHREVGVDVKLSDISLVVTTVQPPMEYVKAVQSAVGSSNGLNIPVKTFELQRVNLTSPSGLQTINIPNQSYSRVLSTFSIPMDIATLQDLEVDGLKGIYDGLENYQYIYGDQAVPNREVPTQQYAGPSRPAAIHQHELKKALDNSHVECLDLHRIPETGFLVARAWSDRGSVSDLSKLPLSLNLSYASTSNKNKIVYNFINNVRVMNVSQSGIVRM